MTLDTEKTIYICTDRTNAEVKLLLPRNFLKQHGVDVVELNLADPNPECTDAAEFRLLQEEMEEFNFEV